MKYIRKYEELNNNDEPQVGDYVICKDDVDELNFFIENNIGEVQIKINKVLLSIMKIFLLKLKIFLVMV